METSNKKPVVMKGTIRVIAIVLLFIIFASSIYMFDSKAYFTVPPKNDPPTVSSSVGPDVHYAIGMNRVVCTGCTGPQPNIRLPSEK